MKLFRWIALATACLALAVFAPAQSVDAFFGFNTLVTRASQQGVPKLGGGLYPNAGGDLIFLPFNLGIEAQVSWRASQSNYFGVGLRPVFYNFGLAWEPVKPGSAIRPDFGIGLGAENLRQYQGILTCSGFTGCTNHSSTNHLLLSANAGLKVYISEHIFLRPSVYFYNIRHNTRDFPDVPTAWQVGLAIGYTLGPSS